MFRSTLTVLFALSLVPACAIDGEDFLKDGLSAGGDSGVIDDEDEPPPSSILECELDVPCDTPFEGMKLAKDGATSYSAGDACVFQALAAGDRALVETVARFSDDIAYLDYAIVGPQAALRQAWGESEAGGRWEKQAHWCELRSADFFEKCAEAPSADCLDPEQWAVRCVPLDNLACPG
jgi:hypothetical protein